MELFTDWLWHYDMVMSYLININWVINTHEPNLCKFGCYEDTLDYIRADHSDIRLNIRPQFILRHKLSNQE